MAGLTDTEENKVLNCYFRAANITAPTAIYMGLFSSNPTDAGGGTELSGNNYSRVNVTSSFGSAASGGAISNTVAIDFPVASGAWSVVTGFGIFDASTSGNLLWWATASLSALSANEFHRIPIGDADFTMD
jgi:hypothetical protein